VTYNDLNDSSTLDSGDVIKVLRAVVGIDPQPDTEPLSTGAGEGALAKAGLSPMGVERAATCLLTLDPARADAGDLIVLQLELADVSGEISGVALNVRYPIQALRLVGPQSLRTGPAVPASAVTLWNVLPAQDDYDARSGEVRLAISDPAAWPENGGVVAELVFEVQPGQTDAHLWPIEIGAGELTPNGFELYPLPSARTFFVGRDPVPATFDSAHSDWTQDGFQLQLRGEPYARYRIQTSTDLTEWEDLTVLSDQAGDLRYTDTGATDSRRFYRAIQE